ncbi:hypothetical protein ACSBO6_08135 [Bacillus sp. AL-1R]
MKKILILLLYVTNLLLVSACQNAYKGKYVRWGDSIKSVNVKKLKENNIPYKVKNNKVYIPEDAASDAVLCCS